MSQSSVFIISFKTPRSSFYISHFPIYNANVILLSFALRGGYTAGPLVIPYIIRNSPIRKSVLCALSKIYQTIVSLSRKKIQSFFSVSFHLFLLFLWHRFGAQASTVRLLAIVRTICLVHTYLGLRSSIYKWSIRGCHLGYPLRTKPSDLRTVPFCVQVGLDIFMPPAAFRSYTWWHLHNMLSFV